MSDAARLFFSSDPPTHTLVALHCDIFTHRHLSNSEPGRCGPLPALLPHRLLLLPHNTHPVPTQERNLKPRPHNPPDEHLAYYVSEITAGSMTLADVEAQIKQTLGIADEPQPEPEPEPMTLDGAGGVNDEARGL